MVTDRSCGCSCRRVLVAASSKQVSKYVVVREMAAALGAALGLRCTASATVLIEPRVKNRSA
jgi:hypothetical protein